MYGRKTQINIADGHLTSAVTIGFTGWYAYQKFMVENVYSTRWRAIAFKYSSMLSKHRVGTEFSLTICIN